jgi:hypothetical protein
MLIKVQLAEFKAQSVATSYVEAACEHKEAFGEFCAI